MRRDIADLVEVLGSHLTDVQINHVAIVGVDLCQFILSEIFSVEPVLDVDVLVWQDDRGVTVMIARGLSVIDLKVLLYLGLIDLEVEIRLSLNLLVNVGCETLLLLAF